MQRLKEKWEILECLVMLLALGYICRGIMGLFAPIWRWFITVLPGGNVSINQLLVTEIIQCSVIFAVIYFFWRHRHNRSWQEIGLRPSRKVRWVQWAVLNGITIFVMMIVLSLIINMLLPNQIKPQEVVVWISSATTPWEITIAIVITGILAPISEEILFRGYLYHTLTQKFSQTNSVLLTALIFGLMHFDSIRILPLMLGGIWLNIVYIKSNSLYPAMIAHGIWNTIMTLMICLI